MSVISEKWNYFLSYFRIFSICDGEITPSRQKKQTSFFVLLSTFRNFCFAEDTRHSEKFKLIWFFIRYFVILPQWKEKSLNHTCRNMRSR